MQKSGKKGFTRGKYPLYNLFIQLRELEADWEGWGADSKT